MKIKRRYLIFLILILLGAFNFAYAELHFKPFVKSYPAAQSPNWEQDAEVLGEVWWNAPSPGTNKLAFIDGSYLYSPSIFGSHPSFIATATDVPELSSVTSTQYLTTPGSALFIRTAPTGVRVSFMQKDYKVYVPDLIVQPTATGPANLTFLTEDAKASGYDAGGVVIDITNGGLAGLTIPITPADPPKNFAGPAAATNAPGHNGFAVGNTAIITWSDLNSSPFTNDDTPPISYDIYVKEGSDFAASGDLIDGTGTNRVERTLGGAAKMIGLSGIPDSGLKMLKDKTTYFFRMRAKDSTTTPDALDRHKTTYTDPGGASNKSVWVHINDLTPPEGITISPDPPEASNQKIHLVWGPPSNDGNDLDGYIVLRAEALGTADPGYPDLGGADTSDNDGPDYSGVALNTTDMGTVPGVSGGAGWVKAYQGSATQFDDTGLDNKKRYKYAVYAYDVVIPNQQQGRNYTSAPATCFGQPGEAPDTVANFIAISSPETSQISLMWDITAASAAFYRGAKIVYTTNKYDWSGLKVNSEEAVNLPATGATSEISIITQINSTSLDPNAIYYFKAFSYNDSGMSKPTGAMAAAVPALGGQGGVGGSIDFALTTGPNVVGIPKFISNVMVNTVGVTTLQELVDAVNSVAGTKVVTAIAYLDKTTKLLHGATYDASGNLTYSDFDVVNNRIPLEAGQAYQVSVSAPVSFTLKSQ